MVGVDQAGGDNAAIGPDDSMSRRLRSRRAYGDDGTSRGRHPSARDLEPLLVHRGEELRSGDEQIDLCVSHRCSRDTDPLHPFRQLDLTGVDRIGGLVDECLVLGESLAQLEALDLLVLDAVELWLGRQGATPRVIDDLVDEPT